MLSLESNKHFLYNSSLQKMLCLPIIIACDERSVTYSTLISEVNKLYPRSHYKLKSFYQVLIGNNQYAYNYTYYARLYDYLKVPLPITPSYLVECEQKFIIIRGKLRLQAIERKEEIRLRKLYRSINTARQRVPKGVDVVQYFKDLSLLTGLKY